MILGCFFPTHVLFLDDNVNHLNSVASEVNEFKVVPELFSNSVQALNYLTNVYNVSFTKEHFLVSHEDPEYAHGMIDIDLRAIHKLITNPKRFRDLSVLISDYSMPEMHGLDFLTNIKELRIKKMMLTGEAEATVAVKAFNNGLINKFIRKDAENFSYELNSALDQLQEEYFADITNIIIETIINDSNYAATCLKHPDFAKCLQQIIEQHEIIEYYLLDEHGSYLLADLDGNLSIFAVKSQESLAEFHLFAKEDAAPEVTTALANKTHLPFFYSQQDLAAPPAAWAEYLYPAQAFGAHKPFYYALITDVARHIPDLGKIVSFKDYLENL